MLTKDLIFEYFNKGSQYEELHQMLEKHRGIEVSITTLKRSVIRPSLR